MQTRRPYYAPTGTMKPEHQCSRRSRSRRGVILLLVISLLALFVLMGVSFSLVALQSLNASKLDIKINQREDDPSSEFDLVLGQLLYDTRARTVMQYHSLLRDLYGYDADTVLNPAVNAPQLRESLQGTVVNVQQQPNGLNLPNAVSAGGQLYTFTFALGPYPPTATNLFNNASALPLDASNNPYIPPSVTALSTIPNYYAGRVITFQGPGPTSNHSSRIVSYNPVAGYSQHQIVSASFNAAGVTSYYYPAYGQITIEAIESKLAGSVTPQVGDTFVINGAPFNGTGAGYDPLTANLDAVLVNNSAIAAAQAGPSALTAVTGMQNLGEYAALLPNYASYNANNTQLVFNALHPTAPNFQTKPANQMGFGGYDESYDVPDYQNMFLAMVAPRTAEAQFSGSPLPIIPSFHRPELVNYWVNFIQQSILAPAGLPATAGSPTTAEQQQILYIITYPYGMDRQRGTIDDPVTPSITLNHLDRVYNIMRGCIFRPMPWDHPNFTGSNPYFVPPTNPTDSQGQFNLLASLINSPVLPQPLGPPVPPANRPLWDVDTDGDGIPESIWIDPGLPIMTTPEGRRYKRLAAIQVRDLDGLINVNAHGNVQQLYAQNIGGVPTYPYLARTPLQSGMMTGGAGTYQTMPTPAMAPYAYTVGLGISNQLFPRGVGFGPAEVQFSNIFNNDATAYANMLFGRYVSQRQTFPFVLPDGSLYTTQPVPDTIALDSGMGSVLNTGFPYARPGVPYSRDPLSVVKHSGVPNDYANITGLPYSNLQPSWYASPPDVWGRGAIVLDVGGQPLMTFMGQPNEMLDSPYELSLSGEENGTDSPYTVAELEVLYRYHDLDATQLSRRLLLAGIGTGGTNWLATENPGVIGTSHSRRNMLTTHASHIPAPSMRAPQEARVNPNLTPFMPMLGSTSILDLYRAKLKANGLTDAQVTQQMLKIVPWEFFKGQKFDINRWLGDGIDNDGDGVVDDVSDGIAAVERAFTGDDFNGDGNPDDNNGDSKRDVPNMSLPRTFGNVRANHTNGFSMADGYSARQAYARHLFCLAMLLLPDDPTAAGQKFQPLFAYDPDANNPANARKLIIRRLAQWAINCVDFRDSDTALTPFEYDENPWNGWSVDGYIGLGPGPDGAWGVAGVDDNMNGVIDERAEAGGGDDAVDDAVSTERGLVWGMETPGVLLTETLAFHDRGVKDTDQDNGAMPNGGKKVTAAMTPDDDLDQFRMPKGSMFVELYSPRPTVWNGEQTGYKPSSGALNLAYTVPGGRPLWRLAFSRLRGGVATGDPNNPAVLAGTNPETITPELILPNGTSWTVKMSPFDPSKQLTVDRFAYFVDVSATLPPNEANASFVNANVAVGNSLSLAPGQYAVVGPRRLTYLGSQNPASATPTPPATSLWGGNSNQYIQLVPNAAVGTESVVVKDTTGLTTSRTSTPAASADARQPVAIVCDMASSLGWRVGMNVSEPLVTGANYYPSTTFPPSDSTTVNLATNPTAAPGPRVTYPDFYDDPDAPSKQFRDQPIEGTGGSPTWPIVANNMQATGTYLDCSSVLLQRLADSTSPYNPMPYDAAGNPDPNYNQNLPVNPYITVDWSTADLTVFTGEEDATNSAFSAQDIYYNNTTPSLYFRSRQRGFLANSGTNNLTSNPWPPISQNGVNATWKTSLIGKTTPTYFGLDLSNASKTAAHPINSGYTPTPTYTILGDNHTLGSLNSTLDYPVVNGMLGTTNYYGEPFIPFPWMTWNNRPFSNPMEMLFVPSSSPGRLALEMTPDYPLLPNNTVSPPTLNNPYLESAATARPFLMHWPFGHMLNLFQTSQIRMDVDNSGATPTFPLAQSSAVTAPHLFRLFDYVEVPSPYVGAERWYNPQNFTTTAAYAPPFNKLSRFRDPGRVNLNTVYDDEVWNSLVAQFPGLQSTDGFTAQFALSRQGDSGTVNVMNPAWPTRFANPFRSADSADLTPNVTAMRAQAQFPIQATLLRANTSGGTPQPLFQINSTNPMASQWMSGTAPGRNTLPGTPGSMANAHDTNRNPYFRYQPLQKLGAVAANNSNCFAVWITIGYFEVEENRPNMTLPVGPGNLMTFDAAHPDGYCLGQEIGIDSGEVTRHRSFYIIDRSIPVGFIPGSRLNTDDCILVRRLIE